MPEEIVVTSETEIAASIRSAVNGLARRLRRTKAGAGLTSTETTVLSSVAARGPLGLSQLATEEGMNPTMVSRVVRSLEEQGLVARAVDPEDRRAATVRATTAGSRLHHRIRSERTDVLAVIVGRLDDHERTTLAAAIPVLGHIVEELNRSRP